MCNPRKIVVRATRQMARAWQAELVRTVEARGSATGEARMVQPLASMLAPPALRAFENAIGVDPAWLLRDGAYHLVIPGGEAIYRPETGELEMIVQLSEELVAMGTGRVTAGGTVTGDGSADATGSYYEDGYGGRTKAKAKAEADALAARQAQQAAEREAALLAEKARREALSDLSGLRAEAETEALLAAQRELAEQAGRRAAELDVQARIELGGLQQATMQGVFRTVASGLQQALLDYAAEHGATGLRVEESGDTVEIQFEMEA